MSQHEGTKLALSWAKAYLEKENYVIKDQILVLRDMPWSKVYQIPTDHGFVYCKQMAPLFSIEPVVLEILSNLTSENIPKVIASNQDLNCFLMWHAGEVLRNKLKTHYQIDLVNKVFKAYVKLQHAAIEKVPDFLNANAQDWRLEQLPRLYLNLISKEEILISDGLTLPEIEILHECYQTFNELCAKLSEYRIPETIDHGDFHDNNILIEDDDVTINDWGDATISHPFFSLTSWLNSATRHHGIQMGDKIYCALQNGYLEHWLQYASKKRLKEAFILVNKLRPVQFVLNFNRVKLCQGIELFPEYKGYIADALKEFIASLNNC